MMKKLLVALALALFLPMNAYSGDYESEKNQYWICHQVGYSGKRIAVALSNVFESQANDYYAKEKIFEDIIENLLGDEFEPEFSARCEDYTSQRKAQKYRKRKLSKYKKENFKLYRIEFVEQRD